MDRIAHPEQQAIDAAIENNWETAITLNTEITTEKPENLGGWLRLGYAHLQLKQVPDAIKAYKKALSIQPKHPLATENLERAKILKEKLKASPTSSTKKGALPERKRLDPTLFLDVPGKTKTVQLVNLGQKTELADLHIGDEVELKIKKRKIEVRSADSGYVGALPDDVSKRLFSFLDAGSTYTTYIKEASLSRVLVFIKEMTKGEDVAQYISFPQSLQPVLQPLNPDKEDESDADEDKDPWEEEEETAPSDDAEEKKDLLHIDTGSDDAEDED